MKENHYLVLQWYNLYLILFDSYNHVKKNKIVFFCLLSWELKFLNFLL